MFQIRGLRQLLSVTDQGKGDNGLVAPCSCDSCPARKCPSVRRAALVAAQGVLGCAAVRFEVLWLGVGHFGSEDSRHVARYVPAAHGHGEGVTYGQCNAGRFQDVAPVGPQRPAGDVCPDRVRAPSAALVYFLGRAVARDIGKRVERRRTVRPVVDALACVGRAAVPASASRPLEKVC